MTLPLACKCQREEREQLEAQIKQERIAFRNSEIIRNGYLDKYYAELTFDKDDSPTDKASQDLRRYVSKWEEMKQRNIGLLLMGGYGSGKTFYASCIANEVRKMGDYVLIGSLSKLIQLMNKDFSKDRDEWEEKIQSYPLMVLDDIGTERDTDYNLEQMESIVDLRYRAKLPLIVTTNLSPDEIKNITGDIRKERTWSRIRGMCAPFGLTGKDRRKDAGNTKIAQLREMLNE